MTTFADSSAVVKLYVEEPDSPEVGALGEPFTVSRITRVEVVSAFWRKVRMGEVSAAAAGGLSDEFSADWWGVGRPPRFNVVGPHPSILEDACRLVPLYGLRAFDAIQLASAVAARTADPSCDRFACYDERLAQAATAEGFRPAV